MMPVSALISASLRTPGPLDAERRSTNPVRMHIYVLVMRAALTRSIAAPSPSPPLLLPRRPASRSRGLLFTLACSCSAPVPLYVFLEVLHCARLWFFLLWLRARVREFVHQRPTLNVARSGCTVPELGGKGMSVCVRSPPALLLACCS